MKATVIETSFGILVFNEKDELEAHALFPRKPQSAAKALLQIEAGRMTSEMAELIKHMRKNGYSKFVFQNNAIAKEVGEKTSVEVEISSCSAVADSVRSNPERFAIASGFLENEEEYKLWMHDITVELAKLRVKGAVERRDLMAAQAIQTLDDLDKATNLLMCRVREWYGVHFPELDRLLEKHETYARVVLSLRSREGFTFENLKKEDIPETRAEGIAKAAEKSMGADLSESDLQQIQSLCRDLLSLYGLRQRLEVYLDKIMEEVAPNTRSLVGSLLGARLIALSGGLSNLARRPASTIQVLGAEKALFRSLKSGTRPPKHGIIFQHMLLHDAKRWQRGKIARALAGKLAIAARVDAFGGRDIREHLKADLERRIGEIKMKYAEPPPLSGTSLSRGKHRHKKLTRGESNHRRKHRRER